MNPVKQIEQFLSSFKEDDILKAVENVKKQRERTARIAFKKLLQCDKCRDRSSTVTEAQEDTGYDLLCKSCTDKCDETRCACCKSVNSANIILLNCCNKSVCIDCKEEMIENCKEGEEMYCDKIEVYYDCSVCKVKRATFLEFLEEPNDCNCFDYDDDDEEENDECYCERERIYYEDTECARNQFTKWK